MQSVDLTYLKSYNGKWVALSRDEKEVIAFGDTLKEAVKKVQEKKYKDPIYTKVVPLESFIPFHR